MAKQKITNEQIIKTVCNDMRKEGLAFQSLTDDQFKNLPVSAMVQTIEGSQNFKNSFINTLYDKIAKTMTYSKNFTNSLKELKKGYIEFGNGIEQIFVKDAIIKNFGEHYEDNGTTESDLIKKVTPEVLALYIKNNYHKKAKATTTEMELRKAFHNKDGMLGLINQIIGSINNTLEKSEFKTTKELINKLVLKQDIEGNAINGITKDFKIVSVSDFDTNPKALLTKIKELGGYLKFPSNEYNVADVETFTNKEDLMLLTNPTVKAKLDVEALATLFHIDKADIDYRVLEVDKLPQQISINGVAENKEVLAILFDKDLVQIYDTSRGGGSFYNPDGEYTNHFANHRGIFATCLFANCVIITK